MIDLPRPPGLYGLACRSGTALDAAMAARLGLPVPEGADPVCAGHDRHEPEAVHRITTAAGTTVLVGQIHVAEDLAARLHLAADCPPAQLAQAAVERYGLDLPAAMAGEWSCSHVGRDGSVLLALSAERRDRLFFAGTTAGLAWAATPFVLAEQRGRDFDETGLLQQWGNDRLRAAAGWRSLLAGIGEVPAGGAIRFGPDGSDQRRVGTVLAPPGRFVGTLDDALDEATALLRRIVHERLPAALHPALLLSGGLDSSLLGWLIGSTAGHAAPPPALCSVAPPELALADERDFAALVAQRHGLALEPLAPAATANPYRAAPAVLAGGTTPLIGNRHCLTTALQDRAQALGARVLVNGTYGELTLTARLPAAPTWRTIARALLRPGRTTPDPFHVALAPHRRAALPDAVRAVLDAPAPPRAPQGDLFGYLPGAAKALALPTRFAADALRMVYPYRDPRLLRLFAGLPRALLQQAGPDRGFGRLIARGQLPDAIRLRQSGLGADPGHHARLQAFAPETRERIAAWRRAGVDDWLDLDWLDRALQQIAVRGVAGTAAANRVQLTALAAELLCWWHAAGSAP